MGSARVRIAEKKLNRQLVELKKIWLYTQENKVASIAEN